MIDDVIMKWSLASGSNFGSEHYLRYNNPDSKVHGAKMGHIWGQQDTDGLHVGPMNFAIWVASLEQWWPYSHIHISV